MPQKVIDYTSPKTGKVHSFDWTKPTDPTPDDFDALKRYVDSIESDTTVNQPKQPTWYDKAATFGLRTVPAVAGGMAGAALTAPSGPGAILGGMAGSGIGSGLGETAAEGYEKWRGLRNKFSPGEIGLQSAIGSIPVLGKAPGAAATAEQLAEYAVKAPISHAIQGATIGAGSTVGSNLIENKKLPSLGQVGEGALYGGAFGLGGGLAFGTRPSINKIKEINSQPKPTIVPPVTPVNTVQPSLLPTVEQPKPTAATSTTIPTAKASDKLRFADSSIAVRPERVQTYIDQGYKAGEAYPDGSVLMTREYTGPKYAEKTAPVKAPADNRFGYDNTPPNPVTPNRPLTPFEEAMRNKAGGALPKVDPVVSVPKVEQPTKSTIELPKELRGAKPRYQDRQLAFGSDLDKALYIIAQKTPSKRDADYLKFAMDTLGATEEQVRRLGADVRKNVSGHVKNQTEGVVTIPESTMVGNKQAGKITKQSKGDEGSASIDLLTGGLLSAKDKLVNKISKLSYPEGKTSPKDTFTDPSALKSNYTSAHTTLLENPKTAKLARPILEAADKKQQWIRDKLDQAAVHVQGLSKSDRQKIGEALATGDTSKLSAEHVNRVNGLKDILDKIDKEAPAPELIKTKGIEDHFTEPNKKSTLRSAIDLFKDKQVSSTEEPKSTNYDIRSALPKYLESTGRDLFDKPALAIAKDHLENIPKSNLKDLASWYIKNYEKSSSEPSLGKEFGSFASKAANLTARSVVDLNPGLHALHLGELPTTVMPKIGLKNTLYGIKDVLSNPVKTWNETSKLGLISDEAKPYAFKTAGEKYRSAAYLFNSAEKLVKGAGYSGAKKMFLDKGLSETEAAQKALELTKDMTLDVSPARQMKGLSSKSNISGGELASKLGSQFKGTPMKLAEQLTGTLANTKNDYGATAKMLAGTLGTIGATKAGAHMFHLDPSSLLKTTALGPFGETVYDTYNAAKRGDYETAVEDALAGTIPGGRAAKKIYESLTNKVERDKQKSAQLTRETKSGNPPLNSARRIFDYLSK